MYVSISSFGEYTLFYKQRPGEFGKKEAKVKQHPKAELLLFENYSLSSSMLSPKNNRYSKNCTKNKYVCLNEVI